MFDMFSSIERAWVVWALSLSATSLLTLCGLRRVRWAHLRQIATDETGAAYTLSYVMVVLLYVFFMCLVVETTLLIVAKFGANYAAYAAARSAIVHYSDLKQRDATDWARWSAIKAMVPFANGVEEAGNNAANGSGLEQYVKDIDRYVGAYRANVGSQRDSSKEERYVRAKYRYANKNMECNLKVPSSGNNKDEPWLVDVTADVDYRYAFHVPGVALLLGEKDNKGWHRIVHGTATLQSEAPKNEKQSLGINYEPWRDQQPWN